MSCTHSISKPASNPKNEAAIGLGNKLTQRANVIMGVTKFAFFSFYCLNV